MLEQGIEDFPFELNDLEIFGYQLAEDLSLAYKINPINISPRNGLRHPDSNRSLSRLYNSKLWNIDDFMDTYLPKEYFENGEPVEILAQFQMEFPTWSANCHPQISVPDLIYYASERRYEFLQQTLNFFDDDCRAQEMLEQAKYWEKLRRVFKTAELLGDLTLEVTSDTMG